ncbi:DUF1206 domain-containing protein [Nocardioides sp. KIGAM211]|uniref:DUF1206 domain-containing protein n=1 Tax=Nocardioides luti TaxID=2761101 RepID=A0A7X0VCX5_9ACTN|nr:DUF1206 domain-containing protein [Nocardioides luti]MBB6629487.1 DUF1206 domain-containing protein [Nocardioides luti]
MGDMKSSAEAAGRRAQNNEWVDRGIRFGMVVYGVVHLVIAWLAIQLALGESSGKASSTGALHQLAQQGFGKLLVWLVALGMVLLVIWKLLDAALGHQEEDGGKKARKKAVDVGKAVIYGAIAFSALKIAVGSGGGGKKKGSSGDTTATVMNWPGGQFIITVVGLAIIGYGISLMVRAWTEKFRENLTAEGTSGDAGTAYIWFGKAGYMAKGIATVIVGGLFAYAGITHEAGKSGGLDTALHKVLQQPFGQVLLILMGIGIGCYGLFCFARARYMAR